MNKTAIRLSLALASGGLALLVGWRLLSDRPREVIALERSRATPPPATDLPSAPLERLGYVDRRALAPSRPGPFEVEHPVFPASHFQRRLLSPEEVWRFFPRDGRCEYDRFSYFRKKANLDWTMDWPAHPEGRWTMRTNSAGFRNDAELLDSPDLRVVVTGDSHSDGVCNNSESFCHHSAMGLEALRPGASIEVLNAACGSYDFHHYLGVLERTLPLEPDVFVVAVYGGNDFESALTLYHHFNGTVRPPGHQLYQREVEAALKACPPLLAQAFLSLKYFAAHPGQMEVALQAARDVLTEIQVTCLREGVRLLVVYIPPLTDVQRERFAQPVEAVREALRLEPDELDSTERMAGALLAFLGERGVPTVDLSADFRSAAEPLYWSEDCHINLAGHRRAGAAIAARIHALVPLGARRVRSAPGSSFPDRPLARAALSSPGWARAAGTPAASSAAWTRAPEDDALQRRPLDEAAVRALFALEPKHAWDPVCFFRLKEGLDVAISHPEHPAGGWQLRTNSSGLRAEGEPAGAPPHLRVLVTGDANVEGACASHESIPGRLQALLAARFPSASVECLNAGAAGYSFYNYVGVLERFLPAQPHAFVVCVNAGNDFYEVLAPWHAFHSGLKPPAQGSAWWSAMEEALEVEPVAVSQFLLPLKYFQQHRGQGAIALRAAATVLLEIQRRCAQNGIELLVVLQPSAHDLDRAALAERLRRACEILDLEEPDLEILSRLGQRLAAHLKAQSVEVLDLSSAPASPPSPATWSGDHHLDVAGSLWAAQAIAERLARRLELYAPRPASHQQREPSGAAGATAREEGSAPDR